MLNLNMSTKIARIKLLAILKTNLAEHKKIFEEAVIGWRTESYKSLESVMKVLSSGNFPGHYTVPQPPQSHASTYESAILMLEMGIADTIDLDPNDFERLVRDNWEWQNQFLAMNSSYSATAARKLG